MSNTVKHLIIWSGMAGYGEKVERTVTCSGCDFKVFGYDNKVKPAFAQHKRDLKAAAEGK
jgi:hypothetical protein